MPLDDLADQRNRQHRGADALAVLRATLHDPQIGPVALVSSFGAESVVLLHLAAQVDPAVPVIFLDTEMLFPESLTYQRDVAKALGLTDVRVITPDRNAVLREDVDGLLHQAEPDACCDLRKARPLEQALQGFGGWITGRKQFQNGQRAALPLFEADGARIKINPLAQWSSDDLRGYMTKHDLPRHPLVAQGYPSIGCMPCTTRVGAGEDPRAGRWRGSDKTECGIHFENGRMVREGKAA
ncbi:phosphoadenylyl-sulfate reductase [Yoonia vestfoldensis]|uniref:Adenosine 5'-phosphosulfate reductase n=1 Tax=Yoonia vestfoldensis TaxID=245188 RepID=A0A1Y0EAB2_9RHOB|nr:phosphoadenylyl-sulfate reductase [Yoonia vestfoldensis]ARU00493.1 putative phosphoadenosine phosphosulfate reductase [Yoonia vestfoldensis]